MPRDMLPSLDQLEGKPGVRFAAANAELSLSHAEKPVVAAAPAARQDHMKDEDNAS